ncbi:MAG: hypothetical protein M0Z48_02375 [Nitrospiraceae bacterium]|nr:hypothetical protein [Nitrospiraceae bacterium]
MYIKKNEFRYLQRLYKSLDEERRNRFMKTLLKPARGPSEEETIKLELVLGEGLWQEIGADPGEIITKKMIRKAYMEVEGKQ